MHDNDGIGTVVKFTNNTDCSLSFHCSFGSFFGYQITQTLVVVAGVFAGDEQIRMQAV